MLYVNLHHFQLFHGISRMERRILSPRVCVPLCYTCEHIMLHGKRDLANIINATDLKIGDYPGLSRWAYLITRATRNFLCLEERQPRGR